MDNPVILPLLAFLLATSMMNTLFPDDPKRDPSWEEAAKRQKQEELAIKLRVEPQNILSGKCCGKEPKLSGWNGLVLFCDRCSRSYDPVSKQQVETEYYKKEGSKFIKMFD